MTERKSSQPSSPSPVGAGKYVLVVGNDTGNSVYTSLLLQKLEYHVCTAANADEALEMVGAILPALIITDLKLSGMHAPRMIALLRQNERTASIPVIIKVDQRTPQLEQKCREAGAVACINKPIKPDELFHAVQSAIEPTPRERVRIHTRLSVTLNSEQLGQSESEGATVLSSRGMYIRTPKPFPVKTIFPIQIALEDRRINAMAKVIYSHKQGEGPYGVPGMGLYFTEITPEDEERLRRYINQELTSGTGPG